LRAISVTALALRLLLLTFCAGLLALFPLGRARATLILRSAWPVTALRTAFLAGRILSRGDNKAR
jgi:hypothetical protein